jgi:NTE family protein
MTQPITADSIAPVEGSAADRVGPEDGTALCLSGGGSRAMLYHAGAVLRLNELGLLGRVDRISGVSGGSIVAGLLARRWDELAFVDGRSTRVGELVVKPLRAIVRHRIDVLNWILGTLTVGSSPALRFADVLDEHLYGGWRMAQLPETPRFVINATNIGTGSLFRFSRPYLGDYLLGRIMDPDVRLAIAVASSSAFPPFYSPLRLDLSTATWVTDEGNIEDTTMRDTLRARPSLGDGGMYDNLGLETAWHGTRTVLVSDAGGTLGYDAKPPGDLVLQSVRTSKVIDRQVRALRKRLLIDGYRSKVRDGAYWGIRSDIGDYPAPGRLSCPYDQTQVLAAYPTRLTRMPERTQERLVNWGYAVADASLRAFVVPEATAPTGFPYPKAGVG